MPSQIFLMTIYRDIYYKKNYFGLELHKHNVFFEDLLQFLHTDFK